MNAEYSEAYAMFNWHLSSGNQAKLEKVGEKEKGKGEETLKGKRIEKGKTK